MFFFVFFFGGGNPNFTHTNTHTHTQTPTHPLLVGLERSPRGKPKEPGEPGEKRWTRDPGVCSGALGVVGDPRTEIDGGGPILMKPQDGTIRSDGKPIFGGIIISFRWLSARCCDFWISSIHPHQTFSSLTRASVWHVPKFQTIVRIFTRMASWQLDECANSGGKCWEFELAAFLRSEQTAERETLTCSEQTSCWLQPVPSALIRTFRPFSLAMLVQV